MFALKDFRYGVRGTNQVIEVKMGQQIDAETLAKHKCDIDKLERTKFLAKGEAPSTGYKKRTKKPK